MSIIGIDQSHKIITALKTELGNIGIRIDNQFTRNEETIINAEGMGNKRRASYAVQHQDGELTEDDVSKEIRVIVESIRAQLRMGNGEWEVEE